MPVPIWMKNVTMVKINVAHALKCLYHTFFWSEFVHGTTVSLLHYIRWRFDTMIGINKQERGYARANLGEKRHNVEI
jgi:hypothetical protein